MVVATITAVFHLHLVAIGPQFNDPAIRKFLHIPVDGIMTDPWVGLPQEPVYFHNINVALWVLDEPVNNQLPLLGQPQMIVFH